MKSGASLDADDRRVGKHMADEEVDTNAKRRSILDPNINLCRTHSVVVGTRFPRSFLGCPTVPRDMFLSPQQCHIGRDTDDSVET